MRRKRFFFLYFSELFKISTAISKSLIAAFRYNILSARWLSTLLCPSSQALRASCVPECGLHRGLRLRRF